MCVGVRHQVEMRDGRGLLTVHLLTKEHVFGYVQMDLTTLNVRTADGRTDRQVGKDISKRAGAVWIVVMGGY